MKTNNKNRWKLFNVVVLPLCVTITPTDSKQAQKIEHTLTIWTPSFLCRFLSLQFFYILVVVFIIRFLIWFQSLSGAHFVVFYSNFFSVSSESFKNSKIDAAVSLVFLLECRILILCVWCVIQFDFSFSLCKSIASNSQHRARTPAKCKSNTEKTQPRENNQRIYFLHTELLLVVYRNACLLLLSIHALFSSRFWLFFDVLVQCARVSVVVVERLFVCERVCTVVIVLDQRTHKYQRTRTHSLGTRVCMRICVKQTPNVLISFACYEHRV